METKSKDALKDLFKTGKIPTEQNFADFINAYIGSVNGNMPDENGNVEVPVSYQVVTMFNPSTPPSSFALGTSVLVFDYDPDENAEWADVLGPDVPAGKQFVITQAYPDEGIFIQQVDTNIDGIFNITLSRANIQGQDAWAPFVNVNQVRTINGISPDTNGNIVLPETQKQASVFFRRETNQTIYPADGTMIFNGKDNNPISIVADADTGIFTLDPTKKYSFDVNPTIQFVSGATNIDYSMFSYVDGVFTQITSQRGFVSNDGSTGSGSSHTGSFVVDGSVHPQVAIRAVTIGGTSETRGFGLLAIYSHVLIKEL